MEPFKVYQMETEVSAERPSTFFNDTTKKGFLNVNRSTIKTGLPLMELTVKRKQKTNRSNSVLTGTE